MLPPSAPLKSFQNRHLLSISFFQAFGAPFIVAHIDGKREVFFGSDRFHVMAMVIGECCAAVYTASFVITAAVVACLLFILDAFKKKKIMIYIIRPESLFCRVISN